MYGKGMFSSARQLCLIPFLILLIIFKMTDLQGSSFRQSQVTSTGKVCSQLIFLKVDLDTWSPFVSYNTCRNVHVLYKTIYQSIRGEGIIGHHPSHCRHVMPMKAYVSKPPGWWFADLQLFLTFLFSLGWRGEILASSIFFLVVVASRLWATRGRQYSVREASVGTRPIAANVEIFVVFSILYFFLNFSLFIRFLVVLHFFMIFCLPV